MRPQPWHHPFIIEGLPCNRPTQGTATAPPHPSQPRPGSRTRCRPARARDASTWQGGTGPRYPEASVEHAAIDPHLNAWLGRLTGNISPAALAGAWQDWTWHLLLMWRRGAPCTRLSL
ncbi:poly-beta-hydroxybutyrate polymerase N-terminal domain-containing protein [Massilia scottii]|uniref:poly-beta-hydroxybutyrate polymerase N-terminal domain-containing protein n=1 Tax=Massilia scottii TaxID=3057166 RepID=UPI0035B64892